MLSSPTSIISAYPADGVLQVTALVVNAVLMLGVLEKLHFLQDVLPFLCRHTQ